MKLAALLQTVVKGYALPLAGDHGVAHWARVLENGLRLAEETGAKVEVVSHFAVPAFVFDERGIEIVKRN